MRKLLSLAMLVMLATGCSGDSPVTGDDDDDGGTDENVWEFSTGDYVLEPGEKYHCWIRNIETGDTPGDPVGIKRFAYTASTGLHHIVIFQSPDPEPDGDRDCDLLEGNWNPRYAGGTVTDPLETPEGVAFPVDATETIVIQLHLLNASTEPITISSDDEITFTEPGDEFEPAALVVSGRTEFEVPPEVQGHDVTATCTVPGPGQIGTTLNFNVFALWPHMHQNGDHFRIDATLSGNTQTLWNEPWDFGDQPLQRLDPPLFVTSGDVINTTCTFSNEGLDPITYGESSNQEMCFDFFFYYPAITNYTLPCIDEEIQL